jgi:predicted alpha/beta hydrolase
MSELGPVSTRTRDGWRLSGEILAESRGRGVALLLHAMMANRKTMDRPRGEGLASMIAAAGLGVVSFDLRGHGESGPSARDGARFSYDDYVLEDLPALVSFVRERFPKDKLVLVGHSLGGHAALAAAGVFPDKAPDAIIGLASNIWLPSWEPSATRRAAKTAFLATWLGITEAWGLFDPRPLRMGNDAVALPYVRQFWQMWSKDRFESLDGRVDYEAALSRVALPYFSVASEGDRLLGHPDAVERFVGAVGGSDKHHRVVTNAESSGRAPDHMGLVTSARSAPVWREIASFAARVTS